MFFSSDRLMIPNEMWSNFCSYIESKPASQMSVEDGKNFSNFTKRYCQICKRERMNLEESLFNRVQLIRSMGLINMARYRDFLKQNPNYKMCCLESTVLIKDALDSSNVRNSVIIVFGNKRDDGSLGSHTFNVYWYRDEMFVCDTMAQDGPYMYNGYLSGVIPFREYMYILNEVYDNIKLYGDRGNNFWNLTFDMEVNNLEGFSEIKMTSRK